MFVRIRVPIGQPHPAILATERAIGSDQGQKFLYVVDDKNQVVYRDRCRSAPCRTGCG